MYINVKFWYIAFFNFYMWVYSAESGKLELWDMISGQKKFSEQVYSDSITSIQVHNNMACTGLQLES